MTLNNKPLRYTLAILLTIGATAFIGILSFGGMFHLAGMVSAAVASTILAIAIEGEIYQQNISKAVNSFLQLGNFIRNNTYIKELKKTAGKQAFRERCPLLQTP